MIVTLADHGELFGEYGTSRHYYDVPPELTNIPLSLYIGDESADSRRVTHPTSIIDVHKTVLETAGVNVQSRNYNLRNDEYGKEYLVESLGIRTPLFNRLQDAGFGDAFLSKIDQPLRGIAISNQCYGFETPEGWFVESDDGCNMSTRMYSRLIKCRLNNPRFCKQFLLRAASLRWYCGQLIYV